MQSRRRWPIVTSILALLLIVVIGGGYLGWRYTQDQYYVGTDGNEVVIFQGVNQTVLGVHLSHVYWRTGIPVAGVPTTYQSQIRGNITEPSLAGAQATVQHVRNAWQACQAAYAAHASYNRAYSSYRTRLRNYEKRYKVGNRPVRSKGKVIHSPPKPPRQPAPIPSNCPGPSSGTSNGGGP